jgi:rod shape-determining protein MreB
MRSLRSLISPFSQDIGIDLGTANTLVYVRGKGIVINEPSIVAVNTQTDEVVAIGEEAKKMLGRTPPHIQAVHPLVHGVISDFEVTEKMIQHFIRKVQQQSMNFMTRPRVVIGVPMGITEVERKAVEDAALNAGVREIYLIEESMAAAIGARLPVQDAVGSMIVDIGGGTTEIAVLSLSGIVTWKTLKIAGDELNRTIIEYVRDEFNLLLGERTAEDIKLRIGSAWELPEPVSIKARGRDLLSGLPQEIMLTDEQIRFALARSVKQIVDAVRSTIESTPPELVADIYQRGIGLAGGGAMLRGMDRAIQAEAKVPVRIVEDPLTAVVRGTGILLEDIPMLKSMIAAATKHAPLTQ